MKNSLVLALVLALGIGAAFGAASSNSPSDILVGEIDVKGQTKKPFTAPSGSPGQTRVTYAVKATLVNKASTDYEDLTVIVKPVKTVNDPNPAKPKKGDTTLKRPAGGSSQSTSGSATSQGTQAHLDFSGGVKTWKKPEVLYAEVVVESDPGQDLELVLNPSTTGKAPDASAHVDMMQTVELQAGAPSVKRDIYGGFNYRFGTSIRNIDPNGQTLTALDGTVAFTTPGIVITSVHLTEAGTTVPVTGANVVFTNTTFSITGFTALKAQAEYDLVVVLNGQEAGDYTVTLTGTY